MSVNFINNEKTNFVCLFLCKLNIRILILFLCACKLRHFTLQKYKNTAVYLKITFIIIIKNIHVKTMKYCLY